MFQKLDKIVVNDLGCNINVVSLILTISPCEQARLKKRRLALSSSVRATFSEIEENEVHSSPAMERGGYSR